MAELRGLNEGGHDGVAPSPVSPARCRAASMTLAAGALVLGLLPGLAAAQADPERGYATQPFTPKSFQMPDGQGCGGEVARWRAVQDNDYASGNIGLKVYHQIQGEIGQAESTCRAGHDAQAQAMIHASKRRHGYPD